MSLAERYPNAVVRGGCVYFIEMEAFETLPMDTTVDFECDKFVSIPIGTIQKCLKESVHNSVPQTIDIGNVPLEDKARFIYCVAFVKDKYVLWEDFVHFWLYKQPKVYKNTTVRFIKEGMVVIEMQV